MEQGQEREIEMNKDASLANALGAALCAHDLVVRELVLLALHARLFNKRARVGHEARHRAADVAAGASVRCDEAGGVGDRTCRFQ